MPKTKIPETKDSFSGVVPKRATSQNNQEMKNPDKKGAIMLWAFLKRWKACIPKLKSIISPGSALPRQVTEDGQVCSNASAKGRD